MTIRPLVLWPDPKLSQQAAPIDMVSDQIRDLARDMLESMYDAKGRGLAAPQIGAMKRLFVMDCTWKEGAPTPMTMINPVIMARDDTRSVVAEGCLSIPGLLIEVDRPAAVTVQWTSDTGEIHMNDFDGFEARCIQHELDHLNGVVTLDHLSAEARADVLLGYAP